MAYTEEQVREIYQTEFRVIPSMNKEEANKVISKYTKPQLINMAAALYGENSMEYIRKQPKVGVIRHIKMMIEGVDRAISLKP